MLINKAIFRSYDIRGNNSDINPIIAYKIGFCFTKINIPNRSQQGQGDKICVARDGRLSSPELYRALVCGITDAGGIVTSIGIAPSPMLYFADKLLRPQASIMITASHNPKDDNGFKMLSQGKPFFDQQIQQLLAEILATDWANIPTEFLATEVEEIDLTKQYIDRILQDITIDPKLVVAWDPANGAAGNIIELLTARLANKNIVINSQIDGNFPAHHPDPTVPKNLEQLMEILSTENCDVGLAFDGDADRIVIISKQRRIILGDQILCILAKDVIDHNPNASIIMDVKTSEAIFEQINLYGGRAILWKTGHSYIKNKILSSKALLAGETSGHIFFADKYYGYDDGIYAALRFLDLLSRSEKSLDELIDQLPKYYNSPEIKIAVADDIKFKIIEQIKTDLIAENIAFNDIDGIRFTSGKSWWLIRASNTEGKIIVKYEADSLEALNNMQIKLTNLLAKYDLKLVNE